MRTSDKQPLEAIKTSSFSSSVVRTLNYQTPEEEAGAVAADIHARGVNYVPDCAVIARTTKLLQPVANALRSEGLEPYLVRRKNDFEHPVVQVTLSVLRLANSRHDREILRRLCVAWEGLTGYAIELEDVAASAALVGGDFLRAWFDIAKMDVEDFPADLLEKLQADLAERLNFPDVAEWFLIEGWTSWNYEDDPELEEEIKIWNELHSQFMDEHGPENATLNAYLQSMDLRSKVPAPPSGAVRCLTVHGPKGLEFKHVYLIGMAQEVLPSFQALKKGRSSQEVEEERRNCFVAITRTQVSLTFIRAEQYYGWPKKPSQFLSEMGLQQQ